LKPADNVGVKEVGQRSFTRGLDVLIAIARNGEVSVADLARELGLASSTAYRYVAALRDYGLIEESQGVYVPGWRLMEISGQHLTHSRLAEVSGPHLTALTSATGETAVLAVRAGSHAVCLRQSMSPASERSVFRINELLPLHAGAGQRMLLAFAPKPIIDLVISEAVSYSPTTPDAESLPGLLTKARHDRLTVSRSELKENSVAVAVPVFLDGEVAASLTLAGPATRCEREPWLRRGARLLRAEAAQMGNELTRLRPG
jgi:DNA-binding IclR family transcriptional regulator